MCKPRSAELACGEGVALQAQAEVDMQGQEKVGLDMDFEDETPRGVAPPFAEA